MSFTTLLVALATLSVLAVAQAAEDVLELPQYVTKLHKGMKGVELKNSLGPFYIPHGQCSGVLDSLLVCEVGELLAIQVSVEEQTQYSRITINDNLRQASVVRSTPCSDEAYVVLELSCLQHPPGRS